MATLIGPSVAACVADDAGSGEKIPAEIRVRVDPGVHYADADTFSGRESVSLIDT
jgi:hypothetical protein